METFSALLAICAGNSPVPVNSPHKGQWRGALMFSLIYAWINDWVNNREAGDLRRQRGHYDVIVMIWQFVCNSSKELPGHTSSCSWLLFGPAITLVCNRTPGYQLISHMTCVDNYTGHPRESLAVIKYKVDGDSSAVATVLVQCRAIIKRSNIRRYSMKMRCCLKRNNDAMATYTLLIFTFERKFTLHQTLLENSGFGRVRSLLIIPVSKLSIKWVMCPQIWSARGEVYMLRSWYTCKQQCTK